MKKEVFSLVHISKEGAETVISEYTVKESAERDAKYYKSIFPNANYTIYCEKWINHYGTKL